MIGRHSYGSIATLWRAAWAPDRELKAAEAASTLFRFFRSKHVADLRLILCVVVFLWGVGMLVALLAVLGMLYGIERLAGLPLTWIGTLFVVGSGVIAWAYRSAATRLGVVDLFACEIGTLCRVSVIFDVAKRFVEQYEARRAAPEPHRFTSQEEYFPVFDNNVRDLQILEATVVAHITEFYTYSKAMRDQLRKLMDTEAPPAGPQSQPDACRAQLANVLYLLFLAHESARKAIEELVEFEPTKAERRMVILLTELTGYAFLVRYFDEKDLRHIRLKLREDVYKKEVPELYRTVMSHGEDEQDWVPARRTAAELALRYKEALGESMDDAVSRLEKAQRREQESVAGGEKARRLAVMT